MTSENKKSTIALTVFVKKLMSYMHFKPLSFHILFLNYATPPSFAESKFYP